MGGRGASIGGAAKGITRYEISGMQAFKNTYGPDGELMVNAVQLAVDEFNVGSNGEVRISAKGMDYGTFAKCETSIDDETSINNAIFFNSQRIRNKDDFEKSYVGCVNSKFHPGIGNYSAEEAVAFHEVGHAAAFNYEERYCDKNYGKRSGRTASRAWVHAWNRQAGQSKLVSDACKNIKKTSYGKGKKNSELIKGISEYASRNKKEAIAEAVTDYMCNKHKANPLSIEIVRLLKEN